MDLAATLDDPLARFATVKDRARAALVDPDGVAAMIDRWLEQLADDPLTTLSARAQRDDGGTGLTLHDGVRVRITAELRRPDDKRPAAPIASGRLSYLRIVRSAGAAMALWRVPGNGAAGPDRAIRLGDLKLRDGQVLALDGRVRAWSIVGAVAPMVTLTATVAANAAATVRRYDPADGRLIRAATLDAGAARAELLLGVLRTMRHRRTGTVLATAARDDAHFLRWSAMREWLLHDRDDALPRLREMAAIDANADVRSAARRTLDRWPGGPAACPA